MINKKNIGKGLKIVPLIGGSLAFFFAVSHGLPSSMTCFTPQPLIGNRVVNHMIRSNTSNHSNRHSLSPQMTRGGNNNDSNSNSNNEERQITSSAIFSDILSPYNKYTHLIAIPMEECHDLCIELESVQRAILYHCPSLIHACVVPVVTRLPLLYVDASSPMAASSSLALSQDSRNILNDGEQELYQKAANALFGSSSSSSASSYSNSIDEAAEAATQKTIDHDPAQLLHKIVQETVLELIYSPSTDTLLSEPDPSMPSNEQSQVANGRINSDGIKPLMIKFKGLEIDGNKNEVLYCVGKKTETIDGECCEGTQRSRKLVETLRSKIEALGYKTMLPPDEPQSSGKEKDVQFDHGGSGKEDQPIWRPRIPFMRLPPDFEKKLPRIRQREMDERNTDNSDDDWGIVSTEEWRSPDDGGNGRCITRLFWLLDFAVIIPNAIKLFLFCLFPRNITNIMVQMVER